MHEESERQGANMPNESDLYRQQQYPKVLRDVTAGDTLGPPEDHQTSQTIRKCELSGNIYPAALIDRMIAENLLDVDEERGVAITARGQRFFDKYR